MIVIALWERLYPWRLVEYPLASRWLGNVGIAACSVSTSAGVFYLLQELRGPLINNVCIDTAAWWRTAGSTFSILVGFLFLDLTRFCVHRIEHAIPVFWSFHALHHSDPDVDVTTAIRHHPVED